MDLSQSQDRHSRDDLLPLQSKSCHARDKAPSRPIYFPSPLNHTSANRMQNRLSRASSAPLSAMRRGGTEIPRLPPRLPTRSEDSASKGMMDDSSRDDSSRDDNNNRTKSITNFFAQMSPIASTTSSPRLPTRLRSVTGLRSGTDGLGLTKMERTVTSDTTSTATTMPRLPTRYSSISDGLDARRMLGAASTATSDDEDDDVSFGAPKPLPRQSDDDDQPPPCAPPSTVISLDNHESWTSTLAGTTITSTSPHHVQGQSSLSWTRFKQLAATSAQQSHAASVSLSEDHAVIVGRQPRRSSRTSLRASHRDVFARQGLAHLHVSCVTLDSALVDETLHKWIGDDDEDDDDDDETFEGGSGHGEESERLSLEESKNDATKGSVLELVKVESKELADGTGDTGLYTGTVTLTNNLPHEEGVMHYSNGKYYKGEWEDGHWHGSGMLLSGNGDSYKGDFVCSTRHGHGVYSYDNGDTYDGDFNADRPHGVGVFNFADHSVYRGGFVFGSFEGHGWYEFEGGRYDGEWKGGCYEGNGTLQFGDGVCYTGQFQAGKAHGSGEEVSATGERRKGLWKHGDLIESEDS